MSDIDPNQSKTGEFKKGESSLGTFYPTHYIVAGYASRADARAAEAALHKLGFNTEDARTVGGREMLEEQREVEDDPNWFQGLQQWLARFAGTETSYVEEDTKLAQGGGAFLLAYAPDDERVELARRVFAQHGPRYARRYLKVAIEIMVRNPDAR